MKRRLLLTIAAVSFVVHAHAAEPPRPRPAPPGPEHEFLKQFVGEWDRTTEAFIEPGRTATTTGTMTGHMIGHFWVVIDFKADVAGYAYHGRGTYGFDSLKTKKYVGTWTDSVSPILWNYVGSADGNNLVLNSEGRHPSLPGTFKYRNTWEFQSKDLLVLTSDMEGPDGKRVTILKSTCRRREPQN